MSAQPNKNTLPFHGKPTAAVVFISPAMAERWMKHNTKNRRLREDDIRAYARDMGAGAWNLTGEAIKFAPDGTLLDGQHRLVAIIRAGVTVPIFVVRGIAPDSQRVMDTGLKRTASDALTISGESHTTVLAAASRLALGVEAGLPDPGHYPATHSEIESFIEDNPTIRVAAEFAAHHARRTDCPPAVVAYTFWVLSAINTADATAFWVSAADKVGLTAGDPVIALTNRFAESRRNRENITKRIYLSLIYRAWNARRAGKTMTFIRINSPAGGLVPVPAPK
jgi:hypothetical protein